jgi:asparagine synthase (glutamine-hydrolysing)
LPALLAGGGVDTRIDHVALHHYMTFHSVVPAPLTILRGVRKVPPGSLVAIEPDGRRVTKTYWTPDFSRHEDRSDWSERDWEDAVLSSLRTAVERRLVADVPVGCLLSGGVDSSLIVGLLAEAGQHGLSTFSIGFESAGGVRGDEFQYSDIVAKRFDTDHHQIRIGTERMLPALDGAIGAMSEPMVSHDCVAFYLLSEEVARHVKVVQSGQGADEVFAGYHWYPPMGAPAAATLEGSVAEYRAAFFDRDAAGLEALLAAGNVAPGDPSERFVTEHFAQAGAETGIDRALRLDTMVMLVDDPVKRVDNMTMAWGLEGRVPFLDHELVELAATCPPELKVAHGGKGVLKEAARRVIPAEVIDRPKGYFPVPALTHLEGPYLDMVRDALYAPVAKERGLFDPSAVDALLADPNGRLTPLRGNELWQIALLELWLQRHGVTGPAA